MEVAAGDIKIYLYIYISINIEREREIAAVGKGYGNYGEISLPGYLMIHPKISSVFTVSLFLFAIKLRAISSNN